ncbi:MAG: hypothetical protein ACRBCL_08185 [Maritimibacter sp.]
MDNAEKHPSKFEMSFNKADFNFTFFSANVDPLCELIRHATFLKNAKKINVEYKQQGWLAVRLIYESFDIFMEITKPHSWEFMSSEAPRYPRTNENQCHKILDYWLITVDTPWRYSQLMIDGVPYSLYLFKQMLGTRDLCILENKDAMLEATNFGWQPAIDERFDSLSFAVRNDNWARIYGWRDKIGISIPALPSDFPLSTFEEGTNAWPKAMDHMQNEIDDSDPLLNMIEHRIMDIFSGKPDPCSSSEWQQLVNESGLELPSAHAEEPLK